MAQTLGALQISKCATSCLHEQTSTLKKKTVLKPNQPNQQKTQVWNPLLQRSSFEHANKNMVSFDILSTKLALCSPMPCCHFPLFHPFPSTESIGLSTMALCRAAGSGWKTLSTKLPDQAKLLARFPPSHCHWPLRHWPLRWLIDRVGWLVGWLVEEHYNYTCVRWWPRLLEWMLLVFSQLLCR